MGSSSGLQWATVASVASVTAVCRCQRFKVSTKKISKYQRIPHLLATFGRLQLSLSPAKRRRLYHLGNFPRLVRQTLFLPPPTIPLLLLTLCLKSTIFTLHLYLLGYEFFASLTPSSPLTILISWISLSRRHAWVLANAHQPARLGGC